MKVKHTKTLKIELTGDDIKEFEGMLQTVSSNGIGFKNNSFSDKQIELAKKLTNKINS